MKLTFQQRSWEKARVSDAEREFERGLMASQAEETPGSKIEILDEYKGCPYCGDPYGGRMSCCGESDQHGEILYHVSVDGKELSHSINEDELIALRRKHDAPETD